MSDNPQIHVSITDDTGVVFEGEIVSLSSVNDVGPFDILYEHANFISLIRERLVLKLANGNTKEIPLQSGVLRCFASGIEVYLGVGQ